MVRSVRIGLLLFLLVGSYLLTPNAAQANTLPAPIVQLAIDDVIGPATVDYIRRAFDKAQQQRTRLIIIRMDTPGGLDTSMREIIKIISNSSIPVATYIAPSGARGASAGTYILLASHIAAMAPGTNVGAATPVKLGGTSPSTPSGNKDKTPTDTSSNKDNMQRKIVNDAVAYIRGLAALHGRNQAWAEKAVREGASVPASEALKLQVIDIIASGIDDLLQQIDGREFMLQGQKQSLKTSGLAIQVIEPDWRSRFLSVITNPNIAYIMMLIGIYGLILEFSNPGAIVPGTVGAISLLLALYAFQLLPINYVGMGLILLGIALMIAEAYAPSFGILGIGGVIAFAIGSVILIDTEAPGFGINLSIIISFSIISALVFILVIGMAIKARRRPVVAGREQLIGSDGIVLEDFDDKGPVKVHSEIWQAVTKYPLHKGQSIKVISSKGLLLEVEPQVSTEPSPLQEKSS